MQRPGLLVGAMLFAACVAGAPPATAHFQGVQIVEHATVTVAGGTRKVYRVYAVFTEGSDRLISWGASPGFPANIFTGPCTGTAFFQAPGGGNTAPSQAFINALPDTEWDTFATIGVSIADQGIPSDLTQLTIGFPAFINGNQVTINNGLVFTPQEAAQNRADFAGDGDPALRVLMMQVTVAPDEYPYGSIGTLTYRTAAGQTLTGFNLSWIGLAAHGRCCVPDGTCVLTYHSACAQFLNGYFLTQCEPCKTCEGTCVPDVAPHPGDGEVNIDDLLAVISAWGPCVPFNVCPPDVSPAPSGNNEVNIDDLLAVISAWGPCK